MSLRHDITRVSELIAPERARYAVGILSLFLVNLSDVLAPVFLAVAVDLIEAELTGGVPRTPVLLSLIGIEATMFSMVTALAAYLALQVAANVFRYPMLMYVAVPSQEIGQTLRNQLTRHMLRLSRPFYDRAKSGDLMSLATNDVQAVRMMLGPGILVGMDTLLIGSLVVVVLTTLSWKLTLIAMIPLPIIAIVTNKLSHAEFQRFRDVQADIATLTERARESYAGVRVIQGYARETFDRDRFERFSWRHYLKNLRLARVRSVFMPTLDLMLGASTVLILVFGGFEVLSGTISLGTFVAFLFLVGYLAGPMIGFGWSVSLFQRGRASLQRIDKFLREPVEIVEPDAPLPLDGRGALEVRGLTFRYAGPAPDAAADNASETASGPTTETGATTEATTDDEAASDLGATADPGSQAPVLRDVSFHVPAGKTLGVLGPVGSGKSTLVALLARLYDPPPGTIFVDGVDIRDTSLEALRQKVVVAPQDTFLFGTTVERNILLGVAHDESASQDARAYARIAHIDEELEALSAGYDTLLGERGVTLSGGQRQRVAIARAIATQPDILVLDDCLSAVDARTEEVILDNLRDVFRGRSGVIVSHRIAAVSSCDEIIVLDAGEVVERGTHDALVALGGLYARTNVAQSESKEAS